MNFNTRLLHGNAITEYPYGYTLPPFDSFLLCSPRNPVGRVREEWELAAITVTCTAPSKIFNLAGLQISNIFISDPGLRHSFKQAVAAVGYSRGNLMGLTVCQAAYEEGEEWLGQLLPALLLSAYLQHTSCSSVFRLNKHGVSDAYLLER